MKLSALLPRSLARRFALVAAGLAVGALLVISLASWWLITRQHHEALRELAAKERQFHAAAVGSQLQALAERMSEVAGSTILAAGLVDSAGRETYLIPFLAGVRQVNGIPVQVLFTDFQGMEIASNGVARFAPEQLEWLRRQLDAGRPGSAVFAGALGYELVAVEPLIPSRTASPEGALLYKVALSDVHRAETMRLEWGDDDGAAERDGTAEAVPVPPVFEPLKFRVRSAGAVTASARYITPQYFPIFVITLVLFSAVVLAGVRFAKLLTGDLRRLEAFSSRFISSGLSSERARAGGSAEVASLAGAINEMLDRLHAQHSVLLREREKLSELATALKEADRRKDQFLAMLAHELRNPLAPIKNSVMVLKNEGLTASQMAWARGVLDRQVDQMSRLLDDLLDVSRITRNKMELRRLRVDLRAVVEAAIETSRPLIDRAGHELAVDLPEAPVYLYGDAVRLAQVFANLLNNAAKYTERGGHIRLAARRDESHVTVAVKDDGIGIAPEMLNHIFEMFMQPASSLTQAQGGLGIGLYLVRSLVEMHGGTVKARSEGPGRGSEFVVRLPLAPANDAAGTEAVPRNVQAGGGPHRVLVVDDNVDAADSLAVLLRLRAEEVTVAYDAATALARAETTLPDVAFFDLGMPNVDGCELARRFRANPKLRSVFLVALTGWGQREDRQRTKEAGFDEHLVKPVNPDTLNRLLDEAPRRA